MGGCHGVDAVCSRGMGKIHPAEDGPEGCAEIVTSRYFLARIDAGEFSAD